MKIKNKILIGLVTVFSIVFVLGLYIGPVEASLKDTVVEQMQVGGEKAGLKEVGQEATDPRDFLAAFIKFALGGFGIIFVILMVVAGYWLLTAHGEEEKIKKAHKTIQGAIVGIIIVLMSYGITDFVLKRAVEQTGLGSERDAIVEGPYNHCCQICDVGGLIEVGCEYYQVESGEACTRLCEEEEEEEFGDCTYMGYIPLEECGDDDVKKIRY